MAEGCSKADRSKRLLENVAGIQNYVRGVVKRDFSAHLKPLQLRKHDNQSDYNFIEILSRDKGTSNQILAKSREPEN